MLNVASLSNQRQWRYRVSEKASGAVVVDTARVIIGELLFSVPARVKATRAGGFLHAAYRVGVTRQMVLERSSATMSAPFGSTVTPTGRPRVLPSSP